MNIFVVLAIVFYKLSSLLYLVLLEVFFRPNSGQHEDVGRADCSGAQDDLFLAENLDLFSIAKHFNTFKTKKCGAATFCQN
jgi:hypothetical protein